MHYRTIPYAEWINRNKSKYPNTANMTVSDIERFCSKITRDNYCWRFESKSKEKWVRFDNKLIHRISYELFVGDIPYGLTIDHLCQNTRCINPKHLEPVTAKVNSDRWALYQKSGVVGVPEYAI